MFSRRIRPRLSLGLVCLSAALLPTAIASASSITVNLRVEGSTKTLFEGPVSAEAILSPPGISTTSSGGAHPCDVAHNGKNGGFVPPAASATAALYDAATATGMAFDAKWFGEVNDFFVTQVGPDIEGGPPEFASWGYAVNYTTAGVGGCQFQLAPGSEVLWAYNYFNLPHLLRLSGPESANAGSPITLHVIDGQTGEAISGAAIDELIEGATTAVPSSGTTDASGNATVTLPRTGSVTLKATSAKSVRSNGLAVCVHNGNDGKCGSTSSTSSATAGGTHSLTLTTQGVLAANVARIAGINDGHAYKRRQAPRVLRGVVEVPAGGTLRDVRIRLERRHRGRCFRFSGARERFMRGRCGMARFFSVGASQSFSYLLPAPLSRGRYLFDIEAVDAAGRVTQVVAGISHVVFVVK
jgi:hypothetical protein